AEKMMLFVSFVCCISFVCFFKKRTRTGSRAMKGHGRPCMAFLIESRRCVFSVFCELRFDCYQSDVAFGHGGAHSALASSPPSSPPVACACVLLVASS